MTPDEFSDLLDRLGADLSRWPEAERKAAEALLAKGPGEAWKQYRVAQFIDHTLAVPSAQPSRQLLDTILLASTQVSEPAFRFWALFSGWQRAMAGAAICASLVAGLYSGWSDNTQVYTETAGNAENADDIPGLTYSPGELGVWQ